ncbi:MAG TPA: ATP-dependent DNA ligase [Candidatus Cybelea sp.]|jgi:DNA ligase-1|nr:ATP-dependent DNA ligase [Candidatus Cybelea sp.]
MERFALTAQRIGATSSKLEKVSALAQYLTTLDDDDLVAATRFFSGTPLGARDRRMLSAGSRTIVEAARRIWRFDDAALRAAYRETGDLGDALGKLVRDPGDAMLFGDRLTPALLDTLFAEMADASGKRSGRRRAAVLERILRACDDPPIATYVVKIITGDLRVGLREGLVLEAIGEAFGAPAEEVRRALMAAGDAGAVALAAKHGALADVRVEYGSPIGFMLASAMPYGDAYPELAGETWVVEDKYDGIRAQAHLCKRKATLFSRRLNDVSGAYPELVAALEAIDRDLILDGEIVAMRDGQVLPFRTLQARLQRKVVEEPLQAGIPIAYVVFDLLACDGDLLVDEPLTARRERLSTIALPHPYVAAANYEMLSDADAAGVNARFEAARARGNEGLIFKRLDAPYLPGRRGKWWRKLKRELSTLDVVVVAVEWGHGKRSGVLSDYTFAVRGDDGRLLVIGKAYSGLTDAEIAELTPWFLDHRLAPSRQRAKARAGEIPVEAEIVLEVAFDVIAQSELHESGFSLRFPRIVRVRDDKPAAEIDTLARVREIYEEMLARERNA